MIYGRLSPKSRAWVDLVGSVLFLIPFCLLAVWSSKPFVMNAFAVGETSPDPGGLPFRFVLKAAIPAGFLLLALQGLSLALKSLMKIASDERRPAS